MAFKRHSIEEIDALSDEEYEELLKQEIVIAESLGIMDADSMEIPELEDKITLRQTPLNKMGYNLLYEDKESKKIEKTLAKIDKLKEAILKSLESYSSGYVRLKPIVKAKDTFGSTLKVIGIYNEYDCEEDENTLFCSLKDAPEDYMYDYDRIEATHLTFESLVSILESIYSGKATIYSKEELSEILERDGSFFCR